jgi:hypothetical protein
MPLIKDIDEQECINIVEIKGEINNIILLRSNTSIHYDHVVVLIKKKLEYIMY